jgi:hypothetical protein
MAAALLCWRSIGNMDIIWKHIGSRGKKICINNDTLDAHFHFGDPPFQLRFKMKTFAATVLVAAACFLVFSVRILLSSFFPHSHYII